MTNDVDLVRVLATDDMGRYLFAKSLLERDEIEYLARGETLKNSQGWSPFGSLDVVTGPAELWVRAEDAERARLLLQALDEPGTGGADDSR